MVIAVVLIVIVGIIAFIAIFAGVGAKKQLQGKIDMRRLFVESLGPQARIIVNNGTHLFWIDDETQTYGVDESGTRYYLNTVFAMKTHVGGLSIQQRGTPQFIDVGKSFNCPIPISAEDIKVIKKELLVYIRKKLESTLAEHSVTPTHEYELNGEIWGCDINSNKFYTTCGGASVYDFSALLNVTIDNGVDEITNIKLAEKRILILVDVDWDDEPFEYSICSDDPATDDETWENLLSMFKGIRNRT